MPTRNRGILIGLASYTFWGIMPLFWKLLDGVDSLEILAHRLLWSAVFLVIINLVVNRQALVKLLKERRAVLVLLGAGLISLCNWGLYIVAILSGHVLQTSMGYFINPLMNIVVGLLFFKERLSPVQIVAVALASLGVLYFTVDYGSFPWLSIGLAATFASYGALKKFGAYPALPALAVETSLVSPLAIGYLGLAYYRFAPAFLAVDASGVLSSESLVTSLLLIAGGILTFTPLLLFARAVNDIPLSWMGFLQFVSPTISFLLSVFIFHEAFTLAHAVCFGLIWSGLLLIVLESLRKSHKKPET